MVGGHLVIIGPGKSNAIELDNLNHKITGLDPNQSTVKDKKE